MNEFREYMKPLFEKMAKGDFSVQVEIEEEKLVSAQVIGYDEAFWTIQVRFDSDNLTQPVRRPISEKSWAYDFDEQGYEVVRVPVKETWVTYSYVKF